MALAKLKLNCLVKLTKKERIKNAVTIATRYGMIDGAHHKQWVIDQMLRTLLEDKYEKVIKELNSDNDYDPWDEGIAP
ncbi:MAG TPA: hypothetical protein VMX17_14480 [Candidatus Glassbacteria bacterium]|nr:hypothetical protein [Candidatus Glassbacteria bacterium]